ncbi:DUF2232 domain-containing protein [Geoalkalibacter sp.]|uniref:DUF2232 domain-containing protein n=1 Tax=Geoalkalibacter sp. TaxID=3041440 RepID=UPI00272E583F|nr:DUF2232 domain-containing protein [Geoalkalibacter sp.]
MERRSLYILGAALLSTAFFLGSQYVAPIALLLNMFGPVPAAYVHMRQGPLAGVVVIVLSCALLLMLLPPVLTLGFLLQYGVVAFFVPFFLRRGHAWDRTLVLTVWAGIAIALPLLLAVSQGQGLSPGEMVRQEGRQVIDQALRFYDEGNLPAQEREALEQTLTALAEVFVRIYPAVTIVLLGVLAAVVVLLLHLFAKGRYAVPGPAFAQWKAPDALIWPVIVAGFALLLEQATVKTLALNVLVVLLPVYFAQGLAVVTHYLRRRSVSPVFRSLIYFLIFVLNPLPMFVTAMGVFDIWIDFRKPKLQKTS